MDLHRSRIRNPNAACWTLWAFDTLVHPLVLNPLTSSVELLIADFAFEFRKGSRSCGRVGCDRGDWMPP